MDNTKNEFSTETNLIILDYERKLNIEKRDFSKITKSKLDFVYKLISRYDDILEISKENNKEYKVVVINGKKNIVSKYRIKTSDINQLKNAISSNSFDNKAEYKRVEEAGKIIRKKRYKPYRIKRLARLLKAAKDKDYNLFINFIKIPDVNHALEVIKANEFGDLDVFMGKNK